MASGNARAQWPAAIANGATTSSTIDLYLYDFIGLQMPAAFTGVTMTFTGSQDGITFTPIFDSAGAAVSYTVAPNRYVMVNFNHFNLFPRFIQLVSGAAEGAARTVLVVGSTDSA